MNKTTVLIFAAAALLAALAVILRLRRLDAKPGKGTVLDRLEGTIRLRDLFGLAVSIEEEGIIFYRRLAGRSADPAVKMLCNRLAAEESLHRQLFKDQLSEWRALPPHQLLAPVLLDEAKQKGVFRHPPGQDASEDEMAAYAIDQEAKSAEFYQAFETAFPQAWKRAHMRALVMEERRHESDLCAAYPLLSRGA